MLRSITRMLAVIAIAGSGIAADAGTAHASASSRLSSGAGAVATTQPTTNIEGRGHNLKWVPNSVKALPVSGTCSSTNYSFLILNKTKATQQIEYQGKPLFTPIPPKNGLYVCASGPIKATFTLKADSGAKLRLVVS